MRSMFALSAAVACLSLGRGTAADTPRAEAKPTLKVQLGHSAGVNAVAYSTDGKLLATGDIRGAVILWEAQTGRELRSLDGTSGGEIYSVAFSPDGAFVLTGHHDKLARLWDTATGKELRSFKGHTAFVCSVAFSPDGKQILTGSLDLTVRQWDAASGQEIRIVTKDALRAVFSPDGKSVLTNGGGGEYVPALWDATTGRKIREFVGHTQVPSGLAFSTDGKQVLTGSLDKTARLWEVATGKEIRAFKGHVGGVTGVAFSPDGKQVLTGSHDKTVRLWDTTNGKEIRTVETFPSDVESVAFSPDGKHVAVAVRNYRPVEVWNALSGEQAFVCFGTGVMANTVGFSADGTKLVVGGFLAWVWDGREGRNSRTLPAGAFESLIGRRVTAAVISPDGKRILAGCLDRKARLWDAETGQELRTFPGHADAVKSVAFSPNGKQVLTCAAGEKQARLWDAESAKELHAFALPDESVAVAAFSPDGTRVLTGGDSSTTQGGARLWDARTGKELRAFGTPRETVYSIAFSPDGKKLVTGENLNTARLWDTETGKVIHEFHGHMSIVSPRGVRVKVMAVAFSPDGSLVLTGSIDGTARLWDVRTGKEVRTLTSDLAAVLSATFSPDGKWVVTGSVDGTAALWDTATGKRRCVLAGFLSDKPPHFPWAVVDKDGRFDASNGGDVQGLHWVVGNESVALKQLKERYYEPGLLAKILGFNKEALRDVAALAGVRPPPAVSQATVEGGKRLALTLAARGGGIGRVQVFVNGKELTADARGPRPDADAKDAKLVVDLTAAHAVPGRPNRVEVVTWNAEGYLSGRGVTLDWTPAGEPDPDPPELYIIAVGVSQYADRKLDLRYAAKDATDLARALELAGKGLFGAGRVHTTLLATGGAAGVKPPTKENIRKAFEAAKNAKQKDVLVVCLAGHGVATGRGSDEYCYLTADAKSGDATALADPEVRNRWAVTSAELAEWVKAIPTEKQVLVLDTCAAGAAAARLLDHRDPSGDQIRAMDRLKDTTGLHILMGCAADRVSYEATRYAQGLLTYSLLKGMAGGKLRLGEFVDVRDLFEYASDEVRDLAVGNGGVQKPIPFAPRGSSFDIGRLSVADRKALPPLATPRPMILRPRFSNADDGEDSQRLSPLVGSDLRDVGSVAPRGGGISFVNADEFAGAIVPVGLYTVQGKTVSLQLVLKRDGKVLSRQTIEGTLDDLPALAAKTAEAIRKEAR